MNTTTTQPMGDDLTSKCKFCDNDFTDLNVKSLHEQTCHPQEYESWKNSSEDLHFDTSELPVNYDPKKATGLVQFPKDTQLETIIDFLNDCNMYISGDKELEDKWKKFMPNLTKEVNG